MKQSIDFEATLRKDFIFITKFKNRLLKYWGTTYTSEGTHVFIKKFKIYPGTKKPHVLRLLRHLNMEDQILSADFSNVEKAELYFKPSRWTAPVVKDREVLATKINSYMVGDKTIIVNLRFKDNEDPKKFQGWTKEQILQYVDENYAELINSSFVESSGNTLIDEAIGLYALLDNEGVFIVNISKAYVAPYNSTTRKVVGSEYDENDSDWEYTTVKNVVMYTTIGIEIEVKKVGQVTPTCQFINAVMQENSELRNRNLEYIQTGDADITRQEAIRRELDEDNNDGDNDFFQGKKLRVAVTDSNYFDRDAFIPMIMGSIDIDYTEKFKPKRSIWSTIISIIVLIVLIVVAYFTGGATSGTVYTYMAAFATYAPVALLVLVAVQMAFANSGHSADAQVMGRWVKAIGIMSIVASIYTLAVNAWQQLTAEKAVETTVSGASTNAATAGSATASSSATTTVVSGAATTASQNALSAALDGLTSAVNNISVSFSNGFSVMYGKTVIMSMGFKQMITTAMKQVVSMIIDRERNKQQSQINEVATYASKLDKELANQHNAILQDILDKEIHIGVEDIVTYTKPLRADMAMFETDYMYEGTKMNIGRPSFVPIGMREIAPIKYEI